MSMLSFSAFILVIEKNDPLYVAFDINFLYISAFFGFFGSIIDSLLGVKPGQKLMTLRTTDEFLLEAKEALRKSSHKLPTCSSDKLW